MIPVSTVSSNNVVVGVVTSTVADAVGFVGDADCSVLSCAFDAKGEAMVSISVLCSVAAELAPLSVT